MLLISPEQKSMSSAMFDNETVRSTVLEPGTLIVTKTHIAPLVDSSITNNITAHGIVFYGIICNEHRFPAGSKHIPYCSRYIVTINGTEMVLYDDEFDVVGDQINNRDN